MKATTVKTMEVNMDELESILRRAQTSPLSEQDCAKIKAVFESYLHLTNLLEDKQMTIQRLRQMLFGASTEKTAAVIRKTEEEKEPESPPAPEGAARAPPQQKEEDEHSESDLQHHGHGRNGAVAYTGAEKIPVSLEGLHPGDSCPECKKGKVYELKVPGVLIRIVGRAPVQAKVYELQKLRCNLCGKVFTAQAPEGIGTAKYDATAASMIALLKYGSGLPFNRLQGLQGSLGIPLPASTQWDIISCATQKIEPVYEELIRQAAQGELLHNDDTTMRILGLTGETKAEAYAYEESKRKGVFTSGIVSVTGGRRMALFFTGRRHAGENLAEVLRHRAKELAAPIQMCDALSRNEPKGVATILANCNAHGRRQFVEVAENFPTECRFVLETLKEVYKNEAVAKKRDLAPQERLQFHQKQSGRVMGKLKGWLHRQLRQRLVEPNSGLGQAIQYMLNHWSKLTQFLKIPGAPLDNNICERSLKLVILHRKNALFYKTVPGAHVGDIFMSLIHTCRLCGADPFDYLTALQAHAGELTSSPAKWMPWNYALTPSAAPTRTDALP
jgi:transposase